MAEYQPLPNKASSRGMQSSKEIKPITSQLRLLILSPSLPSQSSPSPFPDFLRSLTDAAPSGDLTTFAGYTSHPPLKLRTRYYAADVGIWCDEIPLPSRFSDLLQVAKSGSKDATNLDPGSKKESLGIESLNIDATKKTVSLDLNEESISKDEASPDNSTPISLSDWQTQMLSFDAAEVRAVIGGIILILPYPPPLPNQNGSKSTDEIASTFYAPFLEAIDALREAIADESPDREIAALVVVARKRSKQKPDTDLNKLTETIEDQCASALEPNLMLWEFITFEYGESEAADDAASQDDKRNAYGERVGIPRLREVLEGVDWLAQTETDDTEVAAEDEDTDILEQRSMEFFGQDVQREMMGAMLSIHDEDRNNDDDDGAEGEDMTIDQMQSLMERVVAIREAGSEMSRDERETFAKREITKIMREMG